MRQHVLNILVINGAPRAKGNTDLLLERFAHGVALSGAVLKVVDLRTRQIGDCIGCYQCSRDSKCSLEDDMQEIRSAFEESDLLVFACPVYWSGVPGMMKTFIDRLFLYYHQQNRALVSGKRALVLSPLNQLDVLHETAPMVEFFERLFSCLGIEKLGMHFFSGIMKKGVALQRPDYLERAFQLGKSLCR